MIWNIWNLLFLNLFKIYDLPPHLATLFPYCKKWRVAKVAKVANPRFATLKYLAIFSIFGDFLLRSYINSLMIFENHPIFVSTESVLRKFAQTLKDFYYILMKNLGAAAETVLRKCAQTLKDLYYILMKMSKKWLIFIKM